MKNSKAYFNILRTAIVTLSVGFIGVQAFAAIPQLEEKKKSILSRKAGLISKITHKRLTRASNLMSKNDHAGAIKILKKLLETTKSRPFESAQVHQNIGFAYAQKEDFKNAMKHFKAALELKTLPSGPTFTTMYTMAQLHMAKERYKKALAILDEWFYFVDKPSASNYILKASAHSELGQKKKALAAVDKALSLTSNPKESWLQFSVALNYEMKNYKAASSSLKKLTGLRPEKVKYWRQLASIYLTLNQNSKALATLELAYKLNHLEKESELVNLASLYLDQEIPIKAAQVLEKALKAGKIKKNKKNMELLANSYLRAEELNRSIKPMSQAAALSKDGKLYFRQGQVYLEQEQWAKAVKSFNLALKKGKVKNLGSLYLSKGIALYNLKNLKGALKAFELAGKEEKTERASGQWIKHILAENKVKAGNSTASVSGPQ